VQETAPEFGQDPPSLIHAECVTRTQPTTTNPARRIVLGFGMEPHSLTIVQAASAEQLEKLPATLTVPVSSGEQLISTPADFV
jgi:hypothetical protein